MTVQYFTTLQMLWDFKRFLSTPSLRQNPRCRSQVSWTKSGSKSPDGRGLANPDLDQVPEFLG